MANRLTPLFKYMDIDGAKEMLRNGTLKFTCPLKFNDPMDVRKSVCHEFLEEYALSAALRKKLLDVVMADRYSPLEIPANEIMEHITVRRRARIEKRLTKAQVENTVPVNEYLDTAIILCSPNSKVEQGWLDKIRRSHVCCFTTLHPTNPVAGAANQLMWAHYTKDRKGVAHKGVAFGFDLTGKISEKLLEVIYSSEMPNITNEDSISAAVFGLKACAFDTSVTSLYCTKSKCWEYESEWRIIAYYDENRGESTFRGFNPEDVRSIHFGVNCEDEDQKQIAELARGYPNARLYAVRIKPRTFELYEEEYTP